MLIAVGLLNAPGAWASSGSKVVSYRGYRIAVPSAWPVYRLAAQPRVCVRFDRHALYLGRPGADQRCPAHAVGRTEAILVAPLAARGARGGLAGRPLPPVTEPGAQPRQGSSTQVVLPARGIVVTATWARHRATVARALGIPAISERAAGGASAPAGRTSAPAGRARAAAGGAGVGGGGPGAPAAGAGTYTGLGFDSCSAPSMSTMSAWSSSPYHAIQAYLGGTNMACSQSNLTAGWVRAEIAAGWHLIPTYVGLQAPGNSCGCAAITPSRAAAEGAAAANDAVSQAQAIGLGAGNPIYFDMEAYSRGGSSTSAALAFLAAWTSALHAAGYLSGVYSSGASGIADLAAAYGTSYTEPDELWIADWNGLHSTSDPYVPSADWASHQRIHQYSGGTDATYGGATINIDGDYLDGAVAGGSGALPDGTFVKASGSNAIYRVAGGAPLYVSDWSTVGGPQQFAVISQQRLAGLRSVPADGTFVSTAVGAVYRIAGGAPLYVSDWSHFGGPRPFVGIDQWDVDNITSQLSHLHPVPANGTFLTTTTGRVFRVVGGAPLAVSSWSVFGSVQPTVTVDEWDIDNIANPAAHLASIPAAGTLVEGLPSRTFWVFVSGGREQTAASTAAIAVDDAGLAPFAVIVPPRPVLQCLVPSVVHLTLTRAKTALLQAHCRTGTVRAVHHSPRHRALHVIRQSAMARTVHVAGYAVGLTLG